MWFLYRWFLYSMNWFARLFPYVWIGFHFFWFFQKHVLRSKNLSTWKTGPKKTKLWKYVPGSWYLRFRAKCVSCNGIYRVSARGGLFGADGGDTDFDDVLSMFEPFGLIIVDAVDKGHKKARCNSHPTSDIMLAFRKYGVTSRKNLTATTENAKKYI